MDLFEIVFLTFVVEQDVGTKFALMEEKSFLVTFSSIANLFPRVKTTSRTSRVTDGMGYSGVITLRTEVAVPNGACADAI